MLITNELLNRDVITITEDGGLVVRKHEVWLTLILEARFERD